MDGILDFRGAALWSAARLRAFLQACALLTLVASCEAAFAPAYDPAFVAGFNETNEEALALFSALAGGSSAGAYPRYAAQYDGVIGSFEALKLQAEARPVPPLPPAVAARVSPEDCPADAGCAINPTPFNLAGLIENLNLLKERHARVGLVPDYVGLRKEDYEIYAANVLILEEYLKRD